MSVKAPAFVPVSTGVSTQEATPEVALPSPIHILESINEYEARAHSAEHMSSCKVGRKSNKSNGSSKSKGKDLAK